jgi:uncharacterized membrane protein
LNSTRLEYNSALYFLMLLTGALIVVVALGPGIFGESSLSGWFVSWQKQVFSSLCHQQPMRSLYIGEVPMAVCSRCFGIYASFFAGLLVLPILPQSWWRSRYIIFLLIGAIILNITDMIAYASGGWANTNSTRLVTGGLIGISVALLIGTHQPRTFRRS